ncbi:MAG: NTP transferase domain-containing protein [Gammaproteobacteria bacterium]|nr:NTP transferase domain-containing protein [Gammaproteobacteria bacterium]
MIFGNIPTDEAEGTLLAHSIRAGKRTIKKGTRLGADEIARLNAAGIKQVTAARVEAGDIAEQQAALATAEVLAGDGIEVQNPFTGRCNLHSGAPGLAIIDRARIDRLNLSGAGILVATVPPFTVVEPERNVATIKVIPYAVPEEQLNAALDSVRGVDGAIRISPFQPRAVGLVLTRFADMRESLVDKARVVLNGRLETFGSRIVGEERCAHDVDTVVAAIRRIETMKPDLILILGAASISDVADVVPAAMVRAGGQLRQVGIPVDPGNLMTLGTLDEVPIVGLPGCARSPRLNGIDLVLPRLLAGLEVTPQDLLSLGVGGLLSEVSERRQPRESAIAAQPGRKDERLDAVAAVVLAAGSSRRMGSENKLLAELSGKPVISHVVDATLASRVNQVIVVTGHQADRIRATLQGSEVQFVHNPHFPEGLSRSLHTGLGAVPTDVAGAIFCLGDMPLITAQVIDLLIEQFHAQGGEVICVPVIDGRRGNPVLWPRAFFSELLDLSGDAGARQLFARHADRVHEVEIDADAIVTDIDTPETLQAIRELLENGK